jgi:hypothetical protein
VQALTQLWAQSVLERVIVVVFVVPVAAAAMSSSVVENFFASIATETETNDLFVALLLIII